MAPSRKLIAVLSILLASSSLSSPSLSADIPAGASWLKAHQQTDGSWGETGSGFVRPYQATTATLRVLQRLKDTGTAFTDGQTWLSRQSAGVTEETAWNCELIGSDPIYSSNSCAQLQAMLQSNGWGTSSAYSSDVLDTAQSLQALAVSGFIDVDHIQGATAFLLSTQRNDGGWGYEDNASDVYLTAKVLGTIAQYRGLFSVEDAINRALAFLKSQYSVSGNIGDDLISTAVAYRSVIEAGENVTAAYPATNIFLSQAQAPDGSWAEDPYTTAVVLSALSLQEPNLSVQSSDISLTQPFPIEGEVDAIRAVIWNRGPEAAENVHVRFSEGDPLNGGILLGEPTFTSIPPYGVATATVQWNTSSRAGKRRITVQADPDNTVAEISETDNTAAVDVMVATRPDLVVGSGDVQTSPALPTPSDQITIAATIRNSGQAVAEGLTVTLYDGVPETGGVSLGTQTTASVPGGGEVTLTWGGYLTAGSHSLTVVADSAQTITEMNEANNRAVISVTVHPAESDSADLGIATLSAQPSVVSEGETAAVQVVVRNIGRLTASTFVVELWQENSSGVRDLVQTVQVPSLTNGAQFTLNWTGFLPVGTYTLTAKADPAGSIRESDETNNQASCQLRVLNPNTSLADLALNASDLSFAPIEPTTDDEVTVWAVVRNIGNAAASAAGTGIGVSLYDGDPQSGGKVVDVIYLETVAPAEETTVILKAMLSVGSHDLYLMVDPGLAVEELDESNNALAFHLEVYPPLPDLTASMDDIGFTPSMPKEGDSVTIAATVRNNSSIAAQSVHVLLREGPAGSGTILLDTVLPQVSGHGWATIQTTSQFPVGVHLISLEIDPENAIQERSETNNTTANEVKVLTPPDLTSTADDVVVSPMPSFSDEKISLSATIHNAGETKAEQVHVAFFDGDPAQSGLPLGEEHVIYRIFGQSSVRIEKAFFLAPGSHQLYVVVDPQGVVTESSKTNNQVAIPIDVQERPDLSFSGIPTFTPAAPSPDQSFLISALVRNGGTLPLAGVIVGFYDGDPQNGGTPIADPQYLTSLAPGAIVSVSVSGSMAGGYHEICAVVDPDRLVAESNERNNIVYAPLVLSSSLPDLVLKSDETTYQPAAPETGSSITIDAPVWNYGVTAVQGALVRWYDGPPETGILLGIQTIDIAAGSSVHASLAIVLGAGDHNIYTVVDPENIVAEANEANNERKLKLTVADAPGWYDDCGNAQNEPHLLQGGDAVLQGFAGLPEEARTVSVHATAVTYRFSGLVKDAVYRITASFLEEPGSGRLQKVTADGTLLFGSFDVPDDKPLMLSTILPRDSYQDGMVTIAIERVGGANAVISQLWFVKETGRKEAAIAKGLAWTEAKASSWNSGTYAGWSGLDEPYGIPLAFAAYRAVGLLSDPVYQITLNKTLMMQGSDGSWNGDTGTTGHALVALREAGYTPDSPVLANGLRWLRGQVNPDGGWGTRKGYPSTPVYTGTVLMTLMLCGEDKTDPIIVNGARWLKSVQNPSGYWGFDVGSSDNPHIGAWPAIGLYLATSPTDPEANKAIARFKLIAKSSYNFISSLSSVLRLLYYCGGTYLEKNDVINIIMLRQANDGGFVEAYRTYPDFSNTAVVIEYLAKFIPASTPIIPRGISWLDNHISQDGLLTNLMQELAVPVSAGALLAMTASGPMASTSLAQRTENTLVAKIQSFGFWSFEFFTIDYGVTNPSGNVLEALGTSAYQASGESLASGNAITFLKSAQNADGGWPGYKGSGNATNLGTTQDVLIGLMKAGMSLNEPAIIASINYLISKRSTDGGWSTTSYTARACQILQTEGRHSQMVQAAVAWLKSSQNSDGGWGSKFGETSTAGETARAIIALSATGERGIEVARGCMWLISAQNSDGSWGNMPGVAGGTGYTTLTIQALALAQYNLGIDLELLFNKSGYYPSDLVSMVVNPLNRTAEEISVSGWARDQYGSSATLAVSRGIDSFFSEYLVPSNALPGTDTASFSAFSDEAQGAVTGNFVIKNPAGILPDIAVSQEDISLSNEHPNVGERVIVTATIHNLDLIDARDVMVRLYQGDPDSGGLPTGSDILLDRIAGQGSREVTMEWVGEPTVTVIYLVADPDNGITESAEDNNRASKTVQVNTHVPKPDLSITATDIIFSPLSPYSGEDITVSTTVHNTGDTPSTSAVLRFFDSDPRVGGQQIGGDVHLDALDPGGTTLVPHLIGTAGLSGRMYLYAVADPDGSLDETSESNNMAFSFVELRPAALPDLFIPAGGLSGWPVPSLEGENVSITVQVQNHGLSTSGVEVALYEGDPAAGGVVIVPLQTLAGILEQNGTRSVTFSWNTSGHGGNHLIYAVIDPNGKIAEYHEDNNAQSSTLTVVSAHLGVAVTTDGAVFGSNMPVQIQVSAQNIGAAPASTQLEVEVDDAQGSRVAEVFSTSLDLTAGEIRAVPCIWNTGVVLDGDYRVVAKLIQQGRVVTTQSVLITISPNLSVTSTVVTDRTGYQANETARITWGVQSGSPNHDFTNLTAKLTVADSFGATLFTDQRVIPSLVRGQRLAFDTYWGVATHPAGAYPLSVQVTDGVVLLAQTAGTLSIAAGTDPKTLLAGTITASPLVIFSGDGETVAYSIGNIGNRDLPLVHLSIKVVSTDQQTVHAELADTASLAMGAQYSATQSFTTVGYSAADYLTILVAEIDGVSATLAGTYFRIQGAPSAPSVNYPMADTTVATFFPVLIVNNAADPNALDELTYYFELYADAGLTQLVAAHGPVTEGEGTTIWQLAQPLSENTHYWWRCRAYDGWSYGPWMQPAPFFVNTVNDPPGPPAVDHPLDGQDVDVLQPLLVVKNAFDPDEDSLTYNFLVASDPALANVIAQTVGVFESSGATGWQVDQPLAENTWYWWIAQADDWLDVGPWMAPSRFFVNTANDAPSAPLPMSPGNGAETGTAVALTVENAADPDSAALTYRFEMDIEPAFTSPALTASSPLAEGVGTTSWVVPTLLTENTRYHWRAKASDGQAESAWSTVFSLFVNEINEAPSIPTLANPSDGGEAILLQPELEVHNAVDPDGDILTYEFEVYGDAGLTTLVASATAVLQGEVGANWMISVPLSENARYWWRCRAFDGALASAWIPAASFLVNTANDAPTAPILVAPSNGVAVDVLQPALTISNALDPDGALLSYQFEVYGDATLSVPVASTSAMAEGADSTTWTVLPALQDDHQYWWRARAFDGECYGPWMETATFTVHLPVQSIAGTINFDPDTLNLGSRGTWVTVYIELPPGYDVRGIAPATVLLNDTVPAETKPVGYGDEDRDGIPDAMLKFRRSVVEAIVAPGERVVVRVTGMADTVAFEGIDIIRVINP